MAVKLDQETCIGCGVCVSSCPDVFEMDGDKAKVIDADNNSGCAQDAADACPVQCITVE